MIVENDRHCFVCGKDNPEGLQLTPEVDLKASSASLRLSIPKKFQGWRGIAHGGMLSTLFDEVAIYACLGVSQQLVTAEISMRYRKPVPVEELIEVRARMVEQNQRRLKIAGEVLVAGEVCAEGEATVVILKEEA